MPEKRQPHIFCKKGDVAKAVLLPGDIGRVERIIRFWDKARKVSFHREFLVYTGLYKKIPVSVCSTGIGAPSAAIAVEELAEVGAEVFIRIGSCGGLKKEIKEGDIIIPIAAIRAEGTTKEYVPAEFPAVADMEVTLALREAAQKERVNYFLGINRTHDAFYEHEENLWKWGKLYQDRRMQKWALPIVSSEMECSAIFVVATLRGLKSGAVLYVNTPEPLDEKRARANPFRLINSTRVKKGEEKAIKIALEALVLLKERGII